MKSPVKWVGGKARLVDRIRDELPNDPRAGRYIEPFAGGASNFFSYLDVELAPNKLSVLVDSNDALMSFYRMVRDWPGEVHAIATAHAANHDDPMYYYSVRDRFNELARLEPTLEHQIERAGCFAYLNRAGFNGLWRVNKAGDYNVPRGSYRKVALPTLHEYRRAAGMLVNCHLQTGDYSLGLAHIERGSVVYVDPPYIETFAAYAKEGFGPHHQRKLADDLRDAAHRGAHVLLSINDCPLARELYDDGACVLREVTVRHAVGAKEERRKDVRELLIHVRA